MYDLEKKKGFAVNIQKKQVDLKTAWYENI